MFGRLGRVFALAAVVFVLVEGLIIWSVIRYRRKPSDPTLPVQTHGNLVLEIIWTVIPLIVVVALFFASARVLNIVDDRQPENVAVKIEVVGYQWQWKFAYPAEKIEIFGAATAYPEMVVPINAPSPNMPRILRAFHCLLTMLPSGPTITDMLMT